MKLKKSAVISAALTSLVGLIASTELRSEGAKIDPKTKGECYGVVGPGEGDCGGKDPATGKSWGCHENNPTADLGFKDPYQIHRIDFLEIITENFIFSNGPSRDFVRQLSRDIPIALHGLSLDIGGFDPLDRVFIREVRELANELSSPYISDHLCWCRGAGKSTFDLLPLPMTQSMVRHLVERIDRVQTTLKRPLVLEIVSTYVRFASDEMDEADFLVEVLRRSQARLLLDINNVYVNALNHGFSAIDFLKKIPTKAVASFH